MMINKIVFIGYMASGKSSIAKQLSLKLDWEWIDLDKVIEKSENLSIDEIFNKRGELYFRKKENIILDDLINNRTNIVLSVGGGTPCYSNNHIILKSRGVLSIYLKSTIETLFGRLINEKYNRPLINNISSEELKEFIAKHLFERSYFYNQANEIVEVDNKSIVEIADEIFKRLNKHNLTLQ